MAYTVKAVSEMAGVSVRTLHHYDEIGLVRPARESSSGYRRYTTADLERLQQVLFFRELGFSLTEIKAILDHPDFDRRRALREHRRSLLARKQHLERLIDLIDRTLKALEEGVPMDGHDLFDGFDQAEYEEEARRRWGGTQAWEESKRRTASYTQADWESIKREGREITEALAALMDRAPTDPEVQALIRRHHQHINDRFYACPPEMYRGLGNLYVEDERFAANYERVRPGLANFVRRAIHAYCDSLAAD